MTKRVIGMMVVGLLLGAGVIGAVSVSAQSHGGEVDEADELFEKPDVAITGEDLDRASAAALEFTGQGQVTETEIEDEESYYEVEVTLDSGQEVDVQLDEDFNVVGTD